MIDKQTQDQLWLCAPKAFRDYVRTEYKTASKLNEYAHQCVVYRDLFGLHNLTSDAEPEEMISVSRAKVMGVYAYNAEILRLDPTHNGAKLLKATLQGLFGSKCLPDNVDSSESNVDTLAANVDSSDDGKAEPKFKVGDYAMMKGRRVEIIGYRNHHPHLYTVHVITENYTTTVDESDLEPYTEQKVVAKMKPIESKIRVYLATKEEDEEFRSLLDNNGFKWYSNDSLIDLRLWESDRESSKIHFVYPEKIVTYCGAKISDTLAFSEFKKQYFEEESRNLSQDSANCDKAEEKELNLCEILKGHEGIKIFLPDEGEVKLLSVEDNEITAENEKGIKIDLRGDSVIFAETGFAYVYPSREAYLKYPLDARKAWMEWQDTHKPKRWRAERGEEYWYLNDELEATPNQDVQDYIDNPRYALGNYFRTKELAQQAAEAVKTTLEQFHKDNRNESTNP